MVSWDGWGVGGGGRPCDLLRKMMWFLSCESRLFSIAILKVRVCSFSGLSVSYTLKESAPCTPSPCRDH